MPKFTIEPITADRHGARLIGRALAAARAAALFSADETSFSSEECAQAAADALSERGPDGLRVVWRVKVVDHD